jgi:exoribonuclease R
MLKTSDYKHFKIINIKNEIIYETVDVSRVIGLFDGDLVEIDEKCNIKLIERDTQKLKNIVGVLQTSSKIRHGIDKKGHMIYIFRPIDTSYPEFIVASHLNNQIKNQWVVIDYLDWTEKRPRGAIVSIIGSVGDYEIEQKALIKYHRPLTFPKKTSMDEVSLIKEKYSKNIWKNGRLVVSDYTVSIDPVGCRDIDDAFSLLKTNDLIYHLGIHISDITDFIEIDSILDKNASKLGATLYCNNHNLPMWPVELSDNIFSLLTDNERSTLSIFVEYNSSNDTINIKNDIIKTIIINKNQLDYSDKSIYSEKNIDWVVLNKIVNKLREKYGYNNTNDSHEWIETLMIHYNCIVAQNFKNNGIYRNQNVREDEYPQKLQFLLWESALYSLISKGHSCLGLQHYTHATSPIRRYADFLVQKIITNNITISQDIIDILNKMQKQDKKFYRDMFYLDAIYNNMERIVNGILLEDYYSNSNKIYIYIEEWRCKIKIIISLCKDIQKFECVKLQYYIDPNPIQWKKKIIFEIV